MWRETPYVVIRGTGDKELSCDPCTIPPLNHDYEAAILERDPDTGKIAGIHMRIVFCTPDVMRKFGETVIEAAEKWKQKERVTQCLTR